MPVWYWKDFDGNRRTLPTADTVAVYKMGTTPDTEFLLRIAKSVDPNIIEILPPLFVGETDIWCMEVRDKFGNMGLIRGVGYRIHSYTGGEPLSKDISMGIVNDPEFERDCWLEPRD
jgi:hypothetical protein